MSLSDAEALELSELCSAHVDDRLEAEGRRRLAAWLEASEEARRLYVRHLALSASLHGYAAEQQTVPVAPAHRPTAFPHRSRAWIWSVAGLAAAALLTLALIPPRLRLLGWMTGGGPAAEPSGSIAEPAGRLSVMQDARWLDGSHRTGDEFHRGETLRLGSGWAELTFDSGARITLEGPATLEVGSAWEASLGRGSLRVRVPAEAVGFRLVNPSVEAVEPGTEFGLAIGSSGESEVVVLDGAVEVAPRMDDGREREAVRVDRLQGRRFQSGRVLDLAGMEQRLARLRNRPLPMVSPEPPAYAQWSFEGLDPEDPRGFASSGSGIPPELAFARILGRPGRPAPEFPPGRWGRSLRLADGRWLQATFPGISASRPLTVAAWIRMDRTPGDGSTPLIAAWPVAEGRFLQFGIHTRTDGGVPGAVSLTLGRRALVGSTPLADGRWHHVAVVLAPARRMAGAFAWRQYVDGRLEAASLRRGGNRWPALPESPFPTRDRVWIGGAAITGTFPGEIDELVIADRDLTPGEVRTLRRTNRPGPETDGSQPLAFHSAKP